MAQAVEAVIKPDNFPSSQAEKYIYWRLNEGKEKYQKNAAKQNKKKQEKSVSLQIVACKAKLERLILKEADQKAKLLQKSMPDSE